jgi:hypothetical protein
MLQDIFGIVVCLRKRVVYLFCLGDAQSDKVAPPVLRHLRLYHSPSSMHLRRPSHRPCGNGSHTSPNLGAGGRPDGCSAEARVARRTSVAAAAELCSSRAPPHPRHPSAARADIEGRKPNNYKPATRTSKKTNSAGFSVTTLQANSDPFLWRVLFDWAIFATFWVCLVGEKWVKSYCSTFHFYLTNIIQPWSN